MKELKEILNNSQANGAEHTPPLTGHRKRFEDKLRKKEHQPFFNRNNPFWLYAAAASLLLLMGTFVWQWNNEELPESIVLSEVSAVHAEMESFFKDQIKQSRTEVEMSADSLVQKYLLDLKKLDYEHKKLESIHSKSPGNEKIVSALIRNYKTRLQILESLKRYIERNKQNTKSTST